MQQYKRCIWALSLQLSEAQVVCIRSDTIKETWKPTAIKAKTPTESENAKQKVGKGKAHYLRVKSFKSF